MSLPLGQSQSKLLSRKAQLEEKMRDPYYAGICEKFKDRKIKNSSSMILFDPPFDQPDKYEFRSVQAKIEDSTSHEDEELILWKLIQENEGELAEFAKVYRRDRVDADYRYFVDLLNETAPTYQVTYHYVIHSKSFLKKALE